MKDPPKFRVWLYYLLTPIVKSFQLFLELLFKLRRNKPMPLYPYDKKIKKITLPNKDKKEIYQLVKIGDKPNAVKKVAELTGASLRVSKDYVDSFEIKRIKR